MGGEEGGREGSWEAGGGTYTGMEVGGWEGVCVVHGVCVCVCVGSVSVYALYVCT